jgi:hypothetical protein
VSWRRGLTNLLFPRINFFENYFKELLVHYFELFSNPTKISFKEMIFSIRLGFILVSQLNK